MADGFLHAFTYFDDALGIFFNRKTGGMDEARVHALGSADATASVSPR